MLKLVLLVGLAVGGYVAYKRFSQQPADDWDTGPTEPQPGTAASAEPADRELDEVGDEVGIKRQALLSDQAEAEYEVMVKDE